MQGIDITPAELVKQICSILGLGVPIWLWLAWRWRSKHTLLAFEPHRPVPWEGVDIVLVLAVFFLAEFFCGSIGLRLAGITPSVEGHGVTSQEELAEFACDAVARLVTVLIGAAVIARRVQATKSDLGFDFSRPLYDVACGVIAFVAIAPILYTIQIISQVFIVQYHHPLIDTVEKRPEAISWLIVTVSAVFVAPLAEEFFFRVLLQGWLEKIERAWCEQKWDSALAPAGAAPPGLLNLPLGTVPIIVTSELFALTHSGQGAAPIPLFLLALVLGFLYHRTHRLLPSVVVHFLLNGITIAMLFASK
ncbi:MAG TPA: JDVT-CTERM system glutamic-type intramembrane protease [Pirellulales bacterium]|jgi:membrane protease YdiL (CAAX protease family)|nr:JDVT-CTERM system glutamic-type intramembrane protease [Pirellulales bacterium]